MAENPPAPKPKGGRPRAVDHGVLVSAWIPSRDYDRILKAAKAQDVTISAIVRALVRLKP
jgi:hypothetical protein